MLNTSPGLASLKDLKVSQNQTVYDSEHNLFFTMKQLELAILHVSGLSQFYVDGHLYDDASVIFSSFSSVHFSYPAKKSIMTITSSSVCVKLNVQGSIESVYQNFIEKTLPSYLVFHTFFCDALR